MILISDFIPRKIGWREEFDFGDDDCFVISRYRIGGVVGAQIRGYEEGICAWVEDCRFVEEALAGVVDEDL